MKATITGWAGCSAASRGGIFAPLKELIVRIISEAVERTLADIPGEYLGGVTQMNILVISGSRNPQGQTARAMEAFIKGLEAGGGACETVFLPPLTIERCRQCEDNGWGLCRKEGRCIIEDDFSMLLEKLRKADAAVFATPVYFHDLSESLKAFLDRLRRVMRNDAAKPGVAAKPAAGICVAGGGGGGSPLCSFLLERTLATCGFDVLDMVPVRRQNLAMKLPILEAAGKNLTAYRPSAG